MGIGESIIENHAERLEMVMEELSVNAYGLSKSLGYKKATSIYNILNEYKGSSLSSAICERIVLKYPHISLTFLKNGTGDLRVSGKQMQLQAQLMGLDEDEVSDKKIYENEVLKRLERIEEKLNKLLNKK